MIRLGLPAAAAFLVCGSIAGAVPAQAKLDVFVVGTDGRGRLDLTASDANSGTSPRVSPNGKAIAYTSGDGHIWLMDADGGNKRVLFEQMPLDVVHAVSNAVWSPDGRRIAYDVVQVLPIPGYSVAVRDVATGALVQAFPDAQDPTWAPGGGRVAFERGIAPGSDYSDALVTADLSGNERTIAPTLDVLSPAWSPNGRLIAFYGERAGIAPGLYVVRPDGTGRRRLAAGEGPSGPLPRPAWSPDSKQVAFTTDRFRVRVVAVGSGRGRTLGHGVTPSWSPTGARIANFAVEGALQVRSSKTGQGHLVTQVAGGWYHDPPAWSKDGKRLYFTSLSQ